MEKRNIELIPDWRSYFWYYLAGLLFIPLFGIGFVALWLIHRHRVSIRYEIQDTLIRKITREKTEQLELIHILEIHVHQSRIEKRFGTGTVSLHAGVSVIELYGMKNPHDLAGIIQQAVDTENLKRRRNDRRERKEPDHDPGTLDKMDYLTGLWQQGLISNEDYEKEKRHFETRGS